MLNKDGKRVAVSTHKIVADLFYEKFEGKDLDDHFDGNISYLFTTLIGPVLLMTTPVTLLLRILGTGSSFLQVSSGL